MIVVGAVVGLLVWAALGWVLRRYVVARTHRVEHDDVPISEKVHQLARLQIATTAGSFVPLLVAGFGAGAIGETVRHRSTADQVSVAVALIAALVLAFAALVVLPRIPRGAVARVRDVPVRATYRRRDLVIGVVVGVLYAAMITGGLLLVPRHGDGHVWGRLAVYVVAIAILTGVVVPITITFTSRPIPDEQQRQLEELARRLGVRVRGFRLVKGRRQKVANAAQVGLLPGLRYIVITDYLADHLDAPQLDAVIAHELGHARRHHLLIKLGSVIAVWAVIDAVLVALGANATWLVVALAVAFPIGILLVQGLVGIRLEQAADDVAAREVGAEHLAAALDELGRLNHTKRDTGRGWALLTQHPGLQDRLDRLRGSRMDVGAT